MKADNNANLISSVYRDRLEGSLKDALPKLPAVAVLWAGTALMLKELLMEAGVSAWAFAAAGIAVSAVILALAATALRQWIVPGLLALVIAFALAFRKSVSGGVLILINGVWDKLTIARGKIFLDYEETAGSAGMAIGLIIVLLAMLYALSADRGRLTALIPSAVCAAAGIVAGIIPAGSGMIVFCLGMIMIPAIGGISNIKVDLSKAAAVVLCIALAVFMGLMLRNADLAKISQAAELKLHQVRFDSPTNAMPEGRLADLGPFIKNDTEALSVTMEDPEKLYLRGHVYEVYTGSSWEELAASERKDSSDLFYWLHKNDFYGQEQIARAMDTALEEDSQRIKIQNLSACRGTSYLPYALKSADGLDPSLIGDASWGADIDEFTIYNGSVAKWYETQYVLASEQGNAETDSYMALEQSYAAYVKDHDLQLTQESWNVLLRQLGESQGTRSLYEIQSLIRDYLEENMHYDESAYTLSGDGDFLNYMLEKSNGGGYSVQYATAATLMFRYFGVPARYVEGYYLTPEQAEAAEAGKPVILTEENAHAWTEYYLNGVGFVPFEVTPGYIDPEDIDFGPGGSGENDSLYQYQANAMTYAVTEEPEKNEPEAGQKDQFQFNAEMLLMLIPLAALAFIIFVISRRMRLRKALLRIESAPNKEAAALRYGYAMAIKDRAEGLVLDEDAEAAHINELALFSRQDISDNERKQMDEYASEVLDAASKTWGIWRKLKLRLIDGIY